jgi:hypothetical protein
MSHLDEDLTQLHAAIAMRLRQMMLRTDRECTRLTLGPEQVIGVARPDCPQPLKRGRCSAQYGFRQELDGDRLDDAVIVRHGNIARDAIAVKFGSA